MVHCENCRHPLAGRGFDTGDGDIVCEKCFKLRRPNGKPMPVGSSNGPANRQNGVLVQTNIRRNPGSTIGQAIRNSRGGSNAGQRNRR